MKQVATVSCWTDYPFVELGDVPRQKAPLRQVLVISYDGNKYATLSTVADGRNLSVKWGYLYRHRGRLGQVKTVNRRKLERMKGTT